MFSAEYQSKADGPLQREEEHGVTKEKDELLHDWSRLNKELMTLSESEIEKLLAHERKHRARLRVMMRLYHRYSKLRGIREKIELSGAARG